jgi:hypothetical protein
MRSTRNAVLATACLALAACKSSEDRAAARSPAAAVALATAEPTTAARGQNEANRPADGQPGKTDGQPRKIVRTGTLTIEVADYEKVRSAIDGLVKRAGGFVASADVGRNEGSVGSATLILRIPEAEVDAAVAALSRLGTLRRESLRAEDVSESYYDLAARIRNAKRLEERMVELAAKAGGVKDLLEVEREIGRVREGIEVMEGQFRALDDRASLATLTVELVTRETYRPVEDPGFAARIAGAFAGSIDGLVSAAEGFLVFLVSILPWILPIGAGAWFLRRQLRRRA